MQLSIIVPCRNEAANLPELVARLGATYERLGIRCETLLVDDGSEDASPRVMAELQRDHPHVRILAHERNRGLFEAWRTGLAAATGEYVGFIDADLQYQPEDIARLLDHLHWAHCDVVQGSRLNITDQRGLRFWLSRGLNALLNVVFRMSLHDNKSGFFITRKEIAADFLRYSARYAYPQTFVMVSAKSKGYSIGEVRTVFAKREQGRSFIPPVPVAVVATSLLDICRAVPHFRWRGGRLSFLSDTSSMQLPSRPLEQSSAAERRRLNVYLRCMPIHHWAISPDAGTYFAQLEGSQWMPPAEIRLLQNERLRLLVAHAYSHVPFYRRRLEAAGISPSSVNSIEDLANLSPLTKDEIRQHLHTDLLADNIDIGELYQLRTSGSTGTPLSCYVDRTQLELRWATTLRAQLWTGYRFGDPAIRLWHQTIGMKPVQVLKERLDAWWCRRLFIPAYRMSAQNIGEILTQIVGHGPTLLDGYAESMDLLARFLEIHPVQIPTLKGVMSSAQTLSAGSRRIIEDNFQCTVYDKYGAREFSGIAYQCGRSTGYHVMAESYIVEIIKDGRPARPGEIGEVLITDLTNRCMPFLRYKIGDLAVPAGTPTCPCGRGLPLIEQVMGRTQAIIIGTNNQFLPGTFFAHLFKEYDYGIRQFQVYQERPGELEVRIVKGGRFSPSLVDELLGQLHDYLGRDMRIVVTFPEAIPMVQTGKFQHSASTLDFDFQTLALKPALSFASPKGLPEDPPHD